MQLSTAACIFATSFALIQAQTLTPSAAPTNVGVPPNHWCGTWAGRPNPTDLPQAQLLPPADSTRRFFVEPQLQRVPFSPVIASEPKVQVPKFWGNNNFRLALLSYATSQPALRIYSSSKSTWGDFHTALSSLMTECVSKGSGGAYLVPPSPGLTQSTLVVYAYEIGSQFDFQMNYYQSLPYGINPATLGQASNVYSIPASAALDFPASPTPFAVVAPAPAGFTYLGCYNDIIPSRALAAQNHTLSVNTPFACSQFCSKHRFFGVEFGAECYCGDTIEAGSSLAENGCDTPCAGDNKLLCGGVNHLNVYQKGTQGTIYIPARAA